MGVLRLFEFNIRNSNQLLSPKENWLTDITESLGQTDLRCGWIQGSNVVKWWVCLSYLSSAFPCYVHSQKGWSLVVAGQLPIFCLLSKSRRKKQKLKRILPTIVPGKGIHSRGWGVRIGLVPSQRTPEQVGKQIGQCLLTILKRGKVAKSYPIVFFYFYFISFLFILIFPLPLSLVLQSLKKWVGKIQSYLGVMSGIQLS